jgi:hypothetical protein
VMPVSTEFENKDKIYKLVGYLDINEAVKLWSVIIAVFGMTHKLGAIIELLLWIKLLAMFFAKIRNRNDLFFQVRVR